MNKEINLPISRGNTLYVGGSGEGNYTKIQDAIDNSSDGNTVFVFSNSSPYIENINVNVSINLIGENKYTTEIIPYYENKYIINLSADFVYVKGFLINNSYGLLDFGIILESCNNNISDNLINGNYGWYQGICISDYSDNNTIAGNIISDWEVGIYQKHSNNNIISNNIISSNEFFGMLVTSSHNNNIINNTFIENTHDLKLSNSNNNILKSNFFSDTGCCSSISIHNSNNNIIDRNIIDFGGLCAIVLNYNSLKNTLTDNMITGLHDGIYISDSCCYNVITNNTFSDQESGIQIYEFSFYNSIYHNNFINNSMNAYDECNNTWDNGYPSGGNFWDDYNGEDEDGDGIGDIPYPIPGGDNEDRYPLIVPLGENHPPTRPTLDGPFRNETGAYCFIFNTTDPDGDDVFYYIDWGDDFYFDWLGPFSTPVEICHDYPPIIKIYEIRVKAKDIHGAESDWANFFIFIPRTRTILFPLFHWMFDSFPMLIRILTFVL